MCALTVPLADRRLRWGAVLAVAAVIFVASVLVAPGDDLGTVVGPWWDEILHAVGYAGLALAVAYATVESRDRPRRRAAAVLALAGGYGLFVELAQLTVPYRSFAATDLLANLAGASLALASLAVERRVRYRRIGGDAPSTERPE